MNSEPALLASDRSLHLCDNAGPLWGTSEPRIKPIPIFSESPQSPQRDAPIPWPGSKVKKDVNTHPVIRPHGFFRLFPCILVPLPLCSFPHSSTMPRRAKGTFRNRHWKMGVTRKLKCRFVVGSAMALLACIVFPSGKIQASCGDYLTHSFNHQQAKSLSDDSGEKSHGSMPAPCSGPSCSNRPAVPLAPAPSTTPSSQSDDWGWIPGSTYVAERESHFCFEPLSIQPIHQPLGVYHPPR
jgi:hypothetical protein